MTVAEHQQQFYQADSQKYHGKLQNLFSAGHMEYFNYRKVILENFPEHTYVLSAFFPAVQIKGEIWQCIVTTGSGLTKPDSIPYWDSGICKFNRILYVHIMVYVNSMLNKHMIRLKKVDLYYK